MDKREGAFQLMKSIVRAQTVSSRKGTHKNNFSNNVFITKVKCSTLRSNQGRDVTSLQPGEAWERLESPLILKWALTLKDYIAQPVFGLFF